VLASPCVSADDDSIAQHVADEMGHWQDQVAVVRQWLETQNRH